MRAHGGIHGVMPPGFEDEHVKRKMNGEELRHLDTHQHTQAKKCG